MFWQTADDIIKQEMECVRARRIILDQLEGGPKSGKELREAIRKDMVAEAMKAGKEDVEPDSFKVTDPKLYFNTKHLESLGIITSRKDSQHRRFGLVPWAIQPVRRVLGVSRPLSFITSMTRPEDQRPFVTWLAKDDQFDVKILRVIVEEETFARGVSKNLAKYIPDGITKQWETNWHDLSVSLAGNYERGIQGDLMGTYREIEKIVDGDIRDYEVVLDLSMGPPNIALAFSLLAMKYSISAIYVNRQDGENIVTSVLPRG